MHRPNHSNGGAPGHPSRLRRLNNQHLHKDKALHLSNFIADNSPSSPERPESASSLRRHVAASLMQHRHLIERNNHDLQPVSPASYGSSMEVAPYNPAVTPISSVEFKGRIGESHYNLKTSTELLKVLNRIWSLEEQHASNISLIKALKIEFEQARVKIKELLRERQADRHEIDDLVKQIAEDKLVRKNKEQDRIQAAVKSLKDELDDERKLRRRSESLHRKLARELSEVKTTLSSALKDLEKDRKSRRFLEELCDEFARGIKDYEQEVHTLKQRTDKDWTGRHDHDQLILHISETWLDERMQMQLEETRYDFSEYSIVDKLRLEMESFLRAKHINTFKKSENRLPRECQNSSESVPLNEAVSAPQDVGDEESLSSGSDCIELNKPSKTVIRSNEMENVDSHFDQKTGATKKPDSRGRINGRSLSSLEVKLEETLAAPAMSSNGKKISQLINTEQGEVDEVKPSEISISQKSEQCEVNEDGSYEKRNKNDEIKGMNSNYTVDNLIRSQYFSSDGGNMHFENNKVDVSCSNLGWRNQASPVQKWMAKLTSTDLDLPESSSKLSVKENTLKAKAFRSKVKGSKIAYESFKRFCLEVSVFLAFGIIIRFVSGSLNRLVLLHPAGREIYSLCIK